MKCLPVFVLVLLVSDVANAHKGHHHGREKHPSDGPIHIDKSEDAALKQIGVTYKNSIKQIFEKKCMDCHSGTTVFPWYYTVPGVKQFIESDVAEAREHLDISNGYPFKSHATPMEDLDAIREDTEEGSMPPFAYRFMHPTSKVTDEEKRAILEWVKQSKALLENDRR